MPGIDDALKLYQLGWRVVPAPHGGKSPAGSWKAAQSHWPSEEELRREFGEGDYNLFLITGSISRLAVLDCDDFVAVKYWRERLGEVLDETAQVRTAKGVHYYFRLAQGEIQKGRSSPGGESGRWDLRAEGGGVICPPSTHPSGKRYTWAQKRGSEALKDAPEGLWAHTPSDDEKGPFSTLADLLAHPPLEGNRNNWLAKVAGHYAKQIPYEDAYAETVRQVAPAGLDPEEVEKLIESIWRAEQSKVLPPAPEGEGGDWRITEPAEESGWLVSGDERILVRVRFKGEEGWEYVLAPWLNCDLRVINVFQEQDQRTYRVEARSARERREVDVNSKTIGNSTRLGEWLAGLGVGLLSPENSYPRVANTVRMTAYLESQGAPVAQVADSLGWHEQAAGFVTHEGIIKADGMHEFDGFRPALNLSKHAPYTYGIAPADEAATVLREVLSFQDPKVTALFGSWWAACLIKPWLVGWFSQFPIMAIEAPSESGKTRGFFDLMFKLAGGRGSMVATRAVLRDALASHRGGIVWLDDYKDLTEYTEMLRQATVEGSYALMGADMRTPRLAHMRSAVLLSGESLGLRDEKALVDRCIFLDVPSPTKRRSRHGDWYQWEDVVKLMRERDLSSYAGTFVLGTLERAAAIKKRALELKSKTSGRLADTFSVMSIGAWVLEELADLKDHEITRVVEDWALEAHVAYDANDNTLTLKILPEAIRRIGEKDKPEGPDPARGRVATPVFIKDEQVWFSPKLLANWWKDVTHGRIVLRTESEDALMQQARSVAPASKGRSPDFRDFRYSTGEGKHRYRRLSEEMSRKVIERARGEQ